MLASSLFALVALLGGVIAAPVQLLEKRAVPRLGGINLAGCEFGLNTNGGSGTPYCPPVSQITHFASRGVNLYRLPFGWQYMVSNNPASTSLDSAFFAQYDTLVQAALKAGGYVMLDLHNYARWNGGVVGQGGPSDANLARVWGLLAAKYKNEPKIIFGIMNEPHDINVGPWGTTVQASVNAIRAAGATSQMIAMPGTFWNHVEAYLDGQNAPVMKVTDPAGDNSLLILDVHQYLDGDGSGQSRECTTNGVDKLTSMTNFLKSNKRKAILSETGGGNTASCQTALKQELAFVAQNSDSWVGFAAWSAGSFDAGYELSLTPVNGQDNELFTKAVLPNLPGNAAPAPAPASSSSSIKPAAPSSSSSSIKPATPSSSSSKAPVPSSSSAAPSKSSTISTTSKAAATSSAAPRPSSSSSSSSVVPPRSSSSTSVTPPKSSSSSAAVPSGSATAGNLQTYKGALGGFAAPAVVKSGNTYTTAGRSFNFLNDALEGSCHKQMDLCQNAANQGGNKGALTVQACSNQQLQACLSARA